MILFREREYIEWRDIFSFKFENVAVLRINSDSRLRILREVGKILVKGREYIWRCDIFSIVKKNKNGGSFVRKCWGIGEKGVNLRGRRPNGGLATGLECIIFS